MGIHFVIKLELLWFEGIEPLSLIQCNWQLAFKFNICSQVTSQEINYGLTNCTWSSCREGCTAEFFKCHHIRVSYTPQIEFTEGSLVKEFQEEDWAYLDRTEREPETEIEYIVTDTPLLVNIKGVIFYWFEGNMPRIMPSNRSNRKWYLFRMRISSRHYLWSVCWEIWKSQFGRRDFSLSLFKI